MLTEPLARTYDALLADGFPEERLLVDDRPPQPAIVVDLPFASGEGEVMLKAAILESEGRLVAVLPAIDVVNEEATPDRAAAARVYLLELGFTNPWVLGALDPEDGEVRLLVPLGAEPAVTEIRRAFEELALAAGAYADFMRAEIESQIEPLRPRYLH